MFSAKYHAGNHFLLLLFFHLYLFFLPRMIMIVGMFLHVSCVLEKFKAIPSLKVPSLFPRITLLISGKMHSGQY